jgi:hypothetical protein
VTGFLASLLTVERRSEWEFAAKLHDYGGVSFGGDVLGRLALAAALTVEAKELHSFQATFLGPRRPASRCASASSRSSRGGASRAAALVFSSDYGSQWSASLRLGRPCPPEDLREPRPRGAHPSDAALGRLVAPPQLERDRARGPRALWHRQVFARDGALVASIRQEALLAEPVRDASS